MKKELKELSETMRVSSIRADGYKEGYNEALNDVWKILAKDGYVDPDKIPQALQRPEAREGELKCVAPIPCTKNMPQKTVKDWLAKLDEEVTEYKEALFNAGYGLDETADDSLYGIDYEFWRIAEEAADIMTVLVSLNTRIGIDFADRDEAQRRVNQHNHERGRC